MPKRQYFFFAWLWPGLALLTLVLYRILPYDSAIVESWYSRGVFALYRYIWDYTIALLPIGILYILLGVLLYLLIAPLVRSLGWRHKGLAFVKRLVVIGSIGIIMFYWLWAYNYKRTSFRAQTALEMVTPDENFVYDEYCRITDSLVTIRERISDMSLPEYVAQEGQLRSDLQSAYDKMGLPYAGRVRAIRLRPMGSLLHISTAGVYLPFVGQGHIDAGLHPITHPFTMMHEMSHGYGWTGEDVCNFLAFIAAINSGDDVVQYSGYFGYWRYLRSQIYGMDRDRFDTFYRSAPEGIIRDYREIISYSGRYPDIMPRLRDLFYDNYLKSHGISSGLISYSQMILLSHDWQKRYRSLSLNSISDTQR